MDKNKYNDMLQKMTLEIRNQYETATSKVMGEMETQELNDMLNLFFCEEM